MLAKEIIKRFQIEKEISEIVPYGEGHMNTTYLVTCKNEGKDIRYIVQKMNTDMIAEPNLLMGNILNVTLHIRQKGRTNTLDVVPTMENQPYLEEGGDYYRIFRYLEGQNVSTKPLGERHMYLCGRTVGNFIKVLSDYSFDKKYKCQAGFFHDTAHYYERLQQAIRRDPCHRLENVGDEVKWYQQWEKDILLLDQMLEEGKLPIRPAHNDTKLANIMIPCDGTDLGTMIDLDTVMPGLAIYDFGDCIRSSAIRRKNGYQIDLELFQACGKGFLEETQGYLTDMEKKSLPYGVKMISLECGIRYLTDYLLGDVYFKGIGQQSIEKARKQMELVTDIQNSYQKMEHIIDSI